MVHWYLSSLAGFLLTGRLIPVCALVALHAPDCMARRGFERAMERVFDDPGHCRRIAATWLLADALREDARLNALADARAAGPFVAVTLAEL